MNRSTPATRSGSGAPRTRLAHTTAWPSASTMSQSATAWRSCGFRCMDTTLAALITPMDNCWP